MQILTASFDPDTCVLDLRTTAGDEYRVTNAGHARRLKDKISPGGMLSEPQASWLEQYRVTLRETNRAKLRAALKTLREELRS